MREEFMEKAMNIALYSDTDIPVGAVVVKNGEIIAQAFNQKEKNNDITAHAEILALKEAESKLKNWRLEDCELYVTLEPCPMCAWAIIQSRIKAVYFGSYNIQYGAFGSKLNLSEISNNIMEIKGGILEEKCDKILNDFFKKVRNDKQK